MFEIRQHLVGHESDVRCIAQFTSKDSLCLVSGSQDGTVCVWKEQPVSGTMAFAEHYRIKSGSETVAAICEMPSCDQYPNGAIVAACADRKIRLYDGETFQLLKMLQGHDNRVCCLAVSEETGELASGSWDCTARVWRPNDEWAEYIGHSGTVWAVAFLKFEGKLRLLSASADKLIFLWGDDCCPLRSYHGHTDCVRGLYVTSSQQFYSCSNDGTIRMWQADYASSLRTYTGHEHFIFSISSRETLPYFASGSEDHTVRVWEKETNKCLQTFRLPCQTVWGVVIMSNGDIACACSDATIRIFSSCDERKAIPEKISAYEQVLAAFELSMQANDRTGNSTYSDLPTVDILNRPGSRDGQTMLLRDSRRRLQAFSWSSEERRWNCVGPAIEKSIALKKTEKTVYEGKEYDCVFEIDVADDQPHLKLPYNFGDDPWTCAQQFITKHKLPPTYLEKVADFVVESSARVANQNSFATTSIDPFVGSSRQIAAGTCDDSNKSKSDVSDPFTGSARYIPSYSSDFKVPMFDPFKPRGCGMPTREYYTFNSVNAEGLTAKLKVFNVAVDSKLAIEPAHLVILENFARNTDDVITDEALDSLRRCLCWPEEFLLPVVDCLRLVLLTEKGNDYFFYNHPGMEFLNQLCSFMQTNGKRQGHSDMLLVVVLRALSNSFVHQSGRDVMYLCDEKFWANVCEALKATKTSAQVAASSAIANVTYLYASQVNHLEATDRKVRLLGVLVEKLTGIFEAGDVNFDAAILLRISQALITLMWGDYDVVKYAKTMNLEYVLSKLKDASSNEFDKKDLIGKMETMLKAVD
ncbi:phospholipase A 2 activating protein [Trichuris trichiura]|uniref:Phospholipase A 2 activating protein n=1 Tax=Trichuris trichiura TaxID=36087 RepID=A0A077Z6X3_TRITR|nr:phospholipase A 2 activating protein [Trichuris trichiura]